MIAQAVLVGFGVLAPLLFGFAVYVIARGLWQREAAAGPAAYPAASPADAVPNNKVSAHVSAECGGHGGH